MRIWKQDFSLEGLNEVSQNTLNSHLGIVFTEAGEDYLKARMPVWERTVQPMRILHGGASAALAETIGSVASLLCLERMGEQQAVGLEINANHLRPVHEGGWVEALCKPIHLGKTTHVWSIEIFDPKGKLCCISRLTMAIR
jgi:1,4-dihydroxy-2-naphthoyl-CoA hydrolase